MIIAKIIPSVINDNNEYYIHIEEYKKQKELGEHYKHLYSEVKKQKDDVVEYINKHCVNEKISKQVGYKCYTMADTNELEKIMRMLGEIE